jgi:ribosomal protein S18 acetylase RimI-like enzyme
MDGIIIRQAVEADRERVKEIAIAAWFPVTRMNRWQDRFGPLNGRTWQDRRRADLDAYFDAPPMRLLVAESGGRVVAFCSYKLHTADRVGEIDFNAVDPAHQNKGVATALYQRAFEIFREAGMSFARVETGVSDDYSAARHTYAKAGFEQVYGSIVLGMKL